MSEEKATLFEQYRKTLEGIAYRMLGSLSEAHDVVQETYIKWHQQESLALENPRAWLITVCTRLSLNQLKSACKQRECYVGEWLPEPFIDDVGNDLDANLEINESLSIALLHTLEKLTPTERAVFILHDVFDFKFDEIAKILNKNPAACRQLASRARKRVQDSRPRFSTSEVEHQRLLQGFIDATNGLDIDQLVAILSEDAELYSDGGGKVEALPEVMKGGANIARFFIGIFTGYKKGNVKIAVIPQRFNGSLGLLIFEDNVLATALSVECMQDRICRIYAVRNPDKLGFVDISS